MACFASAFPSAPFRISPPSSLSQSPPSSSLSPSPTVKSVASRNRRHIVCSSPRDDEPFELSRRDALTSLPLSLAAAATSLSASTPGGGVANAAGLFSRVTRTTQWESIDLPCGPATVLLDISFCPDDPRHGFLLGTKQTFLETKDGGITWDSLPIPGTEDDFNYRLNSISFAGKEGWVVGKPSILLHTADGGSTWERIPLSSKLPGTPILITALGEGGRAEMTTDQGAIYVTEDAAKTWKAQVQETVEATLNRTVSSGISGASYYTGSFAAMKRNGGGDYVAVNARGNFYMTFVPGDSFWFPHNRNSARRIQNMGWTPNGGLWLISRGGSLFYNEGGLSEEFKEVKISARGYGLLDVGYRNGSEAYAVGGSGSLFKSTDGGQSWVRDPSADKYGANLYACKFVDDNTGFILGNNAVLLRYDSKNQFPIS